MTYFEYLTYFVFSDMKKRHGQMKLWVKQRMVPVFDGSKEVHESHGMLRSVWLGGMVNPQALFTALKHEKAVLAKVEYNEVRTVLCHCLKIKGFFLSLFRN